MRATAQTILAAGPLDLLLYSAGHCKEMRATEFNLGEMLKHPQVNCLGALYLLDALLRCISR